MKKIFALLLISSSIILWAQKIDPEAKRLLDSASSKLSKNSTFYIKFNYLYSQPGKKSISEIGQVYAAKEKYHLILPTLTQI